MNAKSPSATSQLKTVDELANELKVHRITIYRLLSKGALHGFKVGRIWRFHPDEVQKWIVGGKNVSRHDP